MTTLIATLSYAIYLSHKGIIHIVQELSTKFGIYKNTNMMFLVCIAVCIIITWPLNHSIEKPFMTMRNRFIKKD